jgi:hypothetical protein
VERGWPAGVEKKESYGVCATRETGMRFRVKRRISVSFGNGLPLPPEGEKDISSRDAVTQREEKRKKDFSTKITTGTKSFSLKKQCSRFHGFRDCIQINSLCFFVSSVPLW